MDNDFLTSKLDVSKVQNNGHDLEDVLLILIGEIEHLHGSPHDGKQLLVSNRSAIAVVGYIAVYCVSLCFSDRILINKWQVLEYYNVWH